ncbi:MAG: hypothetical protein KAU20_00995 [Nanoarchaeota archaeon]|nr:hypothetical protein [Nanoarchaeota archaeon]
MLNNKKAVSPLVATILLVAFALILGTITMNLGKSYIEGISGVEEQPATITIDSDDIDDPLKIAQIKYITNEITKEEYLEITKNILG